MTLDEELDSLATMLEDSVASGGGAWADASPELKIKTKIRKKRVIFFRIAKIRLFKSGC
jgi:hypothetical protein